MFAEAKRLHTRGLSYKRMEELGLEYRYLAQYLQNKITREEMEEQLERAIKKYAKRQMRWFKRNPDIRWVAYSATGQPSNQKALALAKMFLD
jgi:tRNA A37 N6-isopentenylltransferase MiaA